MAAFFFFFFFQHQRKSLRFVKRSLGSSKNNGLKYLGTNQQEKIQLPEAISYLGRELIKFLSETPNFAVSEFLAKFFKISRLLMKPQKWCESFNYFLQLLEMDIYTNVCEQKQTKQGVFEEFKLQLIAFLRQEGHFLYICF